MKIGYIDFLIKKLYNYIIMSRAKYIKDTPINRFMAKVDVSEKCWLWTAGLKDGYGAFRVMGKTHRAHKWYWEFLNGKVPNGLELDHTCNNRACVNPQHLEAVSHAENVRRAPVGKRNWRTLNITHCPKGHEYSEGNIYRPPNSNERHCRICHKERGILWRKKHTALAT